MHWQKKSVFFAVAMLVAVIFLGSYTASAAVDLAFTLPSSVDAGAAFDITVTVYNNTSDTLNFNKAAAGYLLDDMKIKGPYEVYNGAHSLAPGASTSFTFSFRILYGSGTIVPVGVFLAQDSYQGQNMKAAGAFGIKVN
jgi:hypothetical protein